MRNEEEFRALVYEKANTVRAERKKRQKAMIGTLSGCLVLALVLFGIGPLSRDSAQENFAPKAVSPVFHFKESDTPIQTNGSRPESTGAESSGSSPTEDRVHSGLPSAQEADKNVFDKGNDYSYTKSAGALFPVTVRSNDIGYESGAVLLKNRLALSRYLKKIKNTESGSEESLSSMRSLGKGDFFDEYALVAVCIVSGSGSEHFTARYEGTEGKTYRISVEQTFPIPGENCEMTCDCKTTFLFLAVPTGGTDVVLLP